MCFEMHRKLGLFQVSVSPLSCVVMCFLSLVSIFGLFLVLVSCDYYSFAVLGKVTFKSNALQFALLPKKVTNYVT